MASTYLAEVQNVNTIEVMDIDFLSYVRDYCTGHLTNVFTNVLSDRVEDGRGRRRRRRQFRFHKVLAEHRSIKLYSISVPDDNTEGTHMGKLTVKRSAFSRNPIFEPAKRQSRERMKAVKESTMGIMAASRNIVAISAQQKN